VDYHIIQPSQYSKGTAKSKQLVPYREWIHIDGNAIAMQGPLAIHGPFNFAKLKNRQTRDRVSAKDWLILSELQSLYQNQAPAITKRIMHVDITKPIYEQVRGDQEVQDGLRTFMFNLELNDETLKNFG
jgi:hypothetical protein